MKKSLQLYNNHKSGKICKDCNCGRKEHNMKKNILVLGSEGLIGKALCKELQKNNKIYEFDKKINYDILKQENQDILEQWIKQVDFVYFLAFDVGGAQYLSKYEHTTTFINNNMKMMEIVFSLLEKHNKQFIFISSMMTKMPQSTYGLLKSIGERYTKALGGISVRFWNVYGPEIVEPGKNHVITDFIVSGLKTKEINCKTDGTEVRQFIHTDDAAKALKSIMDNFDKVKELSKNDLNCVDVSNDVWTSIYSIAKHIAKHTDAQLNLSLTKDKVQRDLQIHPDLDIITNHLNWKEEIDIFKGINQLIEHYKKIV